MLNKPHASLFGHYIVLNQPKGCGTEQSVVTFRSREYIVNFFSDVGEISPFSYFSRGRDAINIVDPPQVFYGRYTSGEDKTTPPPPRPTVDTSRYYAIILPLFHLDFKRAKNIVG